VCSFSPVLSLGLSLSLPFSLFSLCCSLSLSQNSEGSITYQSVSRPKPSLVWTKEDTRPQLTGPRLDNWETTIAHCKKNKTHPSTVPMSSYAWGTAARDKKVTTGSREAHFTSQDKDMVFSCCWTDGRTDRQKYRHRIRN
jgi:hypothetical protein